MKLINDLTSTDIYKLKPNNPEVIILHSTKKYPTLESLYDLHVKKYNWYGIGYHFFIDIQNNVHHIRPLDKEGAHAWGFNLNSIGICFYNKENSKKRKQIGKELVSYLRQEVGPLPVISHTLAQIKYINRLFESRGIELIPEDELSMNQDEFVKLEKKLHAFAGSLQTEGNESLKPALKKFKNCPGPSFYDFIISSNLTLSKPKDVIQLNE